MVDQMLENFRRASESSLRMQQEMFNQWVPQWPPAPLNASGGSAYDVETLQKRWIECIANCLNQHRESIDSMYKSGIQLIEQAFRVSEAKTPDEYRRLVEELWRTMFEISKNQSETQLREFQKGVQKWLEMLAKAKV